MGTISTLEEERIYKLLDENYLIIEKHCTFDDIEAGYDIALLRASDFEDYYGSKKVKKIPVAYDNQITLSMFEFAEEYADKVDEIFDYEFSRLKFGEQEQKVGKMLDRIINKIRKLQKRGRY